MWGRRRMLLSCSPLSKMCQETGIVCVPSWIWMRQKKEKGGDVAVAAWQNPPLRGGGVRWQRRNERAPCQREGTWWHTIRGWRRMEMVPHAQCCVRRTPRIASQCRPTAAALPLWTRQLIRQFVINTSKQTSMPDWCFLLRIYVSYRAVSGDQVAFDQALVYTLRVLFFWGVKDSCECTNLLCLVLGNSTNLIFFKLISLLGRLQMLDFKMGPLLYRSCKMDISQNRSCLQTMNDGSVANRKSYRKNMARLWRNHWKNKLWSR